MADQRDRTIQRLREVNEDLNERLKDVNTLRDRYAFVALQALISKGATDDPADITANVTKALAYADEAMLQR